MMSLRFKRMAMIARWKPLHLGHLAILHSLCESGEELLIGIGSSNRYDFRNPFTLEETEVMLRLVLQGCDHLRIIPVPDLDDGPRWRSMVLESFGMLDLFITANPYVISLLERDYRIARPVDLIPLDRQVPVDGSGVRRAMARGENWESLVPEIVAEYIKLNKLDVRFRKEFGLQTLALEAILQ